MATVHEKHSLDISYKTTEPILTDFHVKHLYDGYIKVSLKDYDPKFKIAAMPVYGKTHSNDFFSRTTGPIWLIFCRRHRGTSLYKIAQIIPTRS